MCIITTLQNKKEVIELKERQSRIIVQYSNTPLSIIGKNSKPKISKDLGISNVINKWTF